MPEATDRSNGLFTSHISSSVFTTTVLETDELCPDTALDSRSLTPVLDGCS